MSSSPDSLPMFFGRASAGEHPSRSYDQTLQLHRLLVAGTKTGAKSIAEWTRRTTSGEDLVVLNLEALVDVALETIPAEVKLLRLPLVHHFPLDWSSTHEQLVGLSVTCLDALPPMSSLIVLMWNATGHESKIVLAAEDAESQEHVMEGWQQEDLAACLYLNMTNLRALCLTGMTLPTRFLFGVGIKLETSLHVLVLDKCVCTHQLDMRSHLELLELAIDGDHALMYVSVPATCKTIYLANCPVLKLLLASGCVQMEVNTCLNFEGYVGEEFKGFMGGKDQYVHSTNHVLEWVRIDDGESQSQRRCQVVLPPGNPAGYKHVSVNGNSILISLPQMRTTWIKGTQEDTFLDINSAAAQPGLFKDAQVLELAVNTALTVDYDLEWHQSKEYQQACQVEDSDFVRRMCVAYFTNKYGQSIKNVASSSSSSSSSNVVTMDE